VKVLMLGSRDRRPANAAADEFAAAGHAIVRCDTPDARYPCRGLAAGGECPLDDHVDVAVLVPELGTVDLAHGAICAVRNRVPVVVFDPANAGTPDVMSWTTAAGPDLLDRCERVAHDGHAHAHAVVDRLVGLGVVASAELQPPNGTIAIAVHRDANRLCLTIELADSESDRRAEIARAAWQALRHFDRRPAVIDVAIRSAPRRVGTTAAAASTIQRSP
jgi:hypothetical protein